MNVKLITKDHNESKIEKKKTNVTKVKQKKEATETVEMPECMVRSNTFSKETSENPVELLKNIN